MKIYKFILKLCLLIFLSQNVFAQQNQFKNERRIYLWDVTLSMKGHNGSPDIYDKVVAAMEKDINSICDEHTEIWVLPFQTSVLEKWTEKATLAGKKSLISKIKTYNNDQITYTNIAIPMEYAMNDLITQDKRDVLILLTDGVQNDPKCSKKKLYDLIRKWCAKAEENDAHAFYVMLTEFAQDEELIKVIDETCRMTKYTPDDDGNINITFIEFNPQSNYKYNIKDDAGKDVTLRFDCKKRIEIPSGLKIRCYSEPNSYIKVDEIVSIENGTITISVKHMQDYDSLRTKLPRDTNEKIMLYFEVEDPEKYPLVQLLNSKCCMELINKPEKTLKVYVEN